MAAEGQDSAELRQVSIALAIATQRRPERLDGLLAAIEQLERADRHRTLDIRIAVADNDAAGSAQTVVQKWIDRGADIAYVVEPEEGYSTGRNASVAIADRSADYLAFLDDDDRPDPGWLLHMIEAIERHQADGGSGPQLARDVTGAEWIRWLEERDRQRTGTPIEYAHTNNLVVAMARVEDNPFDDRFRRTGGEDVDWTMRLRRQGCHLIWVDEAVVRSELSADERRLRSRSKQRFKGSRNYSRAMRQTDNFGSGDALRSVVRIAQGIGMTAIGSIAGRRSLQAQGALLASGGFGVLAGLTKLGADRAWRADD